MWFAISSRSARVRSPVVRPGTGRGDPRHRIHPDDQRRVRRARQLVLQPLQLSAAEHGPALAGAPARPSLRARVRHDNPHPAEAERLARRREPLALERVVRTNWRYTARAAGRGRRRIGAVAAEVVIVLGVGIGTLPVEPALRRRAHDRIERGPEAVGFVPGDVLVVDVAGVDEEVGPGLANASKTGLAEPVSAHAEKARRKLQGPSPKVRNDPVTRADRRPPRGTRSAGGAQAVQFETDDAVGSGDRRGPGRLASAAARRASRARCAVKHAP